MFTAETLGSECGVGPGGNSSMMKEISVFSVEAADDAAETNSVSVI